jgi:hypothetical protein
MRGRYVGLEAAKIAGDLETLAELGLIIPLNTRRAARDYVLRNSTTLYASVWFNGKGVIYVVVYMEDF